MIVAVAADETKFRAQLSLLLENNGHQVASIAELTAAAVRAAKPHLLVIALPSGNGVSDTIRGLRAQGDLRLLPILCVDSKGGLGETISLLDAGADDAITRPFQPPIFLARVRTLLRRTVLASDAPEEIVAILTGGPIELRLISRQALISGSPVELTRLEFDLLAHLLRHPNRVFKRDELLAAVWNYPGDVETRTLDKHVEALRRKVGACAEMIKTVHGVGYRFSPA